jgi:Fe-S-cluster containining protein
MAKPASEQDTAEPLFWYAEGLKFQCTGCGDCCTGAPGYVWVNQAEIDALAEHFGMTVAAFEQKYVRQIGIRRSLKELEHKDYDCVFLDPKTRKCQVYEFRPRQCRTWPFWKSNIRTPESWQTTCEVCPGSGRGQFVPLEEIQRQAAVISV